MQFNSIPFLFYFLPLFLGAYYVLPGSWRNGVLVLGSFLFYGFAAGRERLWWLGLLVTLILVTYGLGRLLGKPGRGWLLCGSMVLFCGVLIFFKCWDGGRRLPAGMSFFLFQMAAYLIDVYRGRLEPERNLLAYSVQSAMFPKLLSGPIAEPKALQRQSRCRIFCGPAFHRGLQELILGLGLKVLLADRLSGLWGQAAVVGYESISTPFAWLALTAYSMRLYFDFWGYSLMAVGLGHMLGFHLPMNFYDPYASGSVSRFYRRWHSTLGAWFRDYIYIPMGGSRKGVLRTILNLTVVWLLTGLWHGVGGNYLLWAGILLVLIVNERLWLGRLLNKSRVFCHVYTVFAILLSWLPFAVGDFDQMAIYAGRLFGWGGPGLNPWDFLIWGEEYLPMLICGAFLATPLPGKLWKKIREHPLTDGVLFVLFWIVVYFIATSAQDPFLYFAY